jgi:hypothetical protein
LPFDDGSRRFFRIRRAFIGGRIRLVALIEQAACLFSYNISGPGKS